MKKSPRVQSYNFQHLQNAYSYISKTFSTEILKNDRIVEV